MNAEQLTTLVKAIQNYSDEQLAIMREVIMAHEVTIAQARADVDALAVKLRDVTTALVQADGAILTDLSSLREYVMDHAFGPLLAPTPFDDFPPGAMIEFVPPKRKWRFSRAR